jgi:hypothetical protein
MALFSSGAALIIILALSSGTMAWWQCYTTFFSSSLMLPNKQEHMLFASLMDLSNVFEEGQPITKWIIFCGIPYRVGSWLYLQTLD